MLDLHEPLIWDSESGVLYDRNRNDQDAALRNILATIPLASYLPFARFLHTLYWKLEQTRLAGDLDTTLLVTRRALFVLRLAMPAARQSDLLERFLTHVERGISKRSTSQRLPLSRPLPALTAYPMHVFGNRLKRLRESRTKQQARASLMAALSALEVLYRILRTMQQFDKNKDRLPPFHE